MNKGRVTESFIGNKPSALIILLCIFLSLQLFAWRFLPVETGVVIVYLALNTRQWKFSFDASNLITPRNIAWLIFFFRLYVLPLTAVFSGYDSTRHAREYSSEEIFLSYYIIFIAYISFLVGWEFQSARFRKEPIIERHIRPVCILITSLIFIISGLVSMVLYFPDFKSFLLNIYVETRHKIEVAGLNKFLKPSVVFARAAIPVGLAGILTIFKLNQRSRPVRYLIIGLFFILILAATWNENRQTMVYPLLALLAALSGRFLRIPLWPALFSSVVVLYLLMVFMQIRISRSDANDDKRLNAAEFIHLVQTYAGGPVQVAPVLLFPEQTITIPSSFFHSLPVLGKPFRDRSGVEQYNEKIYSTRGIIDQVFPTSAEAYLNGGLLLLVLLYLLFGYAYSYLNSLFVGSEASDIFYRFPLFMMILLCNAVILQSFQVFGQFLYYNAFPAMLILWLYRKKNISPLSRTNDRQWIHM